MKIEEQQNKFIIKRRSKTKEVSKESEPVEQIKTKDWNNTLKEDTQQNQITINEEITNIPDISEQQNILRSKKDNLENNNIIVRKINFNIIDNEYNPQSQSKSQISEQDNNKNDWKNTLKEEIQQSKFTIKRKSKVNGNKEKIRRKN